MDLEKFIKQKPSDFVVEEIIPFKPVEKSDFALYLLKKSNLSTLQVIRFLSLLFRIKPSQVGFAGLKDKFAITTQYITLPSEFDLENICYVNKGGRWLKVGSVDFGKQAGFCLRKKGYINKSLEIGDNAGNLFRIKVRNFRKDQRANFYKNMEIVKKFGCPNYFGEQRFGSVKSDNSFIFLHLLRGDYEKALKAYFSIKGEVKNWGNWEAFYRDMRGKLEQYERDVILGLKRGLSFEKAFRILPKNIRLMFNFAFQSYLWNEYLRKYIEKKYPFKRVPFIHRWKLSFYLKVDDIEYLKNLEIPYTGREYPVADSKLKEIILQTLSENGVSEDMQGKEVGGIKVLTDGIRKAVFFPQNLKVIEKTKNSITLSFFLPTGSYATILLRALIF